MKANRKETRVKSNSNQRGKS